MDTMYPAATFSASRSELLGEDPLLGPAEVARGVCRDASRTVSVLAVTRERMRRIDGWLGPVGFVTHAAAPESGAAVLGSVCDRDRALELLQEIVVSLVGPLPESAADAGVDLAPLDGLSPATVPAGIEWVVVVSATSPTQPAVAQRRLIAAAGGLLVGELTSIDTTTPLTPIGPDGVGRILDELVGPPIRPVRDLLVDD